MSTTTPDTARPLDTVLRRWPSVAGVAFATFVAWGLASGGDLAPVLTASAFVYLGAAAVGRRGAAWPLFFVTFVVIGVASFTTYEDSAVWILVALGAVLLVFGLQRGEGRPFAGLPLQGLAALAFCGAAAAALLVGGDLAAYLVAAGLLAHAAWDVYHHRVERVVSRSLAEFCVVLDTILAVVIVVVTLRG
ncbi:hypothetical protein AB0B28_20770 [Glycomyces sp. NPDC046736]|uniref:hypothetical protein n=1 Tax=Glycomyces sp. NPDC046736 TaxID=3155615 RepID=UPI0033EA8481